MLSRPAPLRSKASIAYVWRHAALMFCVFAAATSCIAQQGSADKHDQHSDHEHDHTGSDAKTSDHAKDESKWIQLFNGKNLDGWTPKIKGHDLGENPGDIFRVEDGVLKVSYDKYDQFDEKFGHLFYKDKFSHYKLRMEYRFLGEQTSGGPGWAFRNSGAMIHGQAPETMDKDQSFPVSIEVQLLGGDGDHKRSNANLCTPGTHVVMNGKLEKRHCINSTSKTYHGDQWVVVEVEVRGHEVIKHLIDGEVVLTYNQPQLDENDADAKKLIKAGQDKTLHEGTISLQAESHSLEFRKVELLVLEP